VLRKVGVDRVIFGGDYPLDEPTAAMRAVISRGFTDGDWRPSCAATPPPCSRTSPSRVRPAQQRQCG
jgi:hypothetical protein